MYQLALNVFPSMLPLDANHIVSKTKQLKEDRVQIDIARTQLLEQQLKMDELKRKEEAQTHKRQTLETEVHYGYHAVMVFAARGCFSTKLLYGCFQQLQKLNHLLS